MCHFVVKWSRNSTIQTVTLSALVSVKCTLVFETSSPDVIFAEKYKVFLSIMKDCEALGLGFCIYCLFRLQPGLIPTDCSVRLCNLSSSLQIV